jgi:hypothetical protein
VAAGLALVGLAAAFILTTQMRPSYDAFGWMVWGRQVLHWNLNTDGAPSWKPLTFLFTVPYALTGREGQLWLWMLTATAAALAGAVFAARIAFRLSGASAERPWAGVLAAVLAAAGVLGMSGLAKVVFIANSDPMNVTLCLAAFDAHLSGRRRLCFALLVLAGLGRPEAWPLAAGFGLWLGWRSRMRGRIAILLALACLPLAWFLIPGLTSHSWLGAARFDLGLRTAVHGNRVIGVLSRLRSIYALPMQIAVAGALLLALVRRDRRALAVAGAAAIWVAVEIGFALHGFSAVARYLLEPAALLIALTAGAIGWLVRIAPFGRPVLRVVWIVPLVVLLVALAPTVRSRVHEVRAEIHLARHASLELTRLRAVIARVGGPKRIKACGQPTTLLGYQSELAWAVGLNVGDVGWRPGRSIARGDRVVLLKPHDEGWQVRLFNQAGDSAVGCGSLRTNSTFGPA